MLRVLRTILPALLTAALALVLGAVPMRGRVDHYPMRPVMGNNSILATNASLDKKLAYDPQKDFVPTGLIGLQANILVVNQSLPARSLAELIALAKAHPGKLNFGSSGCGAAAHLAGELFKSQAHIDIVYVAYKGAAPALQDLIAGDVQMMFATSASVMGFIKAGSLRPLAVTTLRRKPLLPGVATIDELGIKGFEATTWHGLVAPAATPPAVVDKLYRATAGALDDDAVRQSLSKLGVDIVGDSPPEFAAYIAAEIPKWKAIVEASEPRSVISLGCRT